MADNTDKVFYYFAIGQGSHKEWLYPIGGTEVKNVLSADVIILGSHPSDIAPNIYGDSNWGKQTMGCAQMDDTYIANFCFAKDKKKKVIGLNRGALFLCAKAGGELIQDVNGHGSNKCTVFHHIVGQDKHRVWVNSMHHQMMNPYTLPKSKYDVLAVMAPNVSSRYLNQFDNNFEFGDTINKQGFIEPEVIHFTDIDSLAIQANPEELNHTQEAIQFYRKLVKQFIND